MRNQVYFFANKEDLKILLKNIESKSSIKYVMCDQYNSPNVRAIPSLAANQNLGLIYAYPLNRKREQKKQYLVINNKEQVKVRKVSSEGKFKYAIDQLINPTTIVFQPSGEFCDKCLLSGTVGTISENMKSLALFKLFKKEISLHFTKIKSFYVGKEALNLLELGWRLTTQYSSPKLYDLKKS